MAELVDARDLKFPATTATAQLSCKTSRFKPAETGAVPPHLQNNSAFGILANCVGPAEIIQPIVNVEVAAGDAAGVP
ncbi:hypothetical protein [Bradyrhizobium sp. UFLA05-112]